MLKVGIIGCGSISQFRHAPEFDENEFTQIAGFFDPVTERAQKLADKYHAKVYLSAEDMMNDKEIDIISICSANRYHYEQTILALKAGKHVLCEKPMATSVEQAEEMAGTAEECGKKLMIAENFRVAPAHIKAKELIESGEIGDVYTFRAVFGHNGPELWATDKSNATWFFKKDQCFAGCLGDLSIHKIDFLRWIFNDEVEEAAASCVTLEKAYDDGKLIDVEDNAVSILKFKSGILGTLTSSWTYKGAEDHSTVVYGSKGTLKIYDHPQFPLTVVKENGEKAYYETGKIPTNDGQFKTGIIDAFVTSVVEDTKPLVTGRDGVEDLRLVITLLRASETKQWEKNL